MVPTSDGFIVEVRIPFKSLRDEGDGPQAWGLNIHRKVQRTGYEDTWTDARRVSSFLAQSGTIDGLHDGHFGFTNLALDGTVKPDFSQVESSDF